MPNVIFRGPSNRQPNTKTLLANGALKPGTFVTHNGVDFSAAAAAGRGRLLLLTNMEMKDQLVTDAYADNDSAIAYEIMPGDKVQAIADAATYTEGQALTTASGGILAAAAATDTVVAFVDGSAGVLAADGLIDVVIANAYTVPA